MSIIKRHIREEARLLSTQFRAISIIGPRQSGKTTLGKWLFDNKPYINFENPDIQTTAEDNPRQFLSKYPKGAILDEVQRVPDIFRYLQEILDNTKQSGKFILTGSNNFLLQERISQSLAGRIGYLQLLPFSYAELQTAGLAEDNILKHILTGGYPEIWDKKLIPHKWMSSYVQKYVQRDVRLLRNITNLAAFNRFIMLCAHYAGQILNRQELAGKVGVDTKTIQSWLAVLESSYIIFLLQPWYNNLSKRIIKSPKLYFHDTGLLCYLLGISSQASLQKYTHYGAIFENWIISEVQKNRFNQGINEPIYYFRDSAGNEVDLIMNKQEVTWGIEIKTAKKLTTSMTAGLKYWEKNFREGRNLLIYGGNEEIELSDTMTALGWNAVGDI